MNKSTKSILSIMAFLNMQLIVCKDITPIETNEMLSLSANHAKHQAEHACSIEPGRLDVIMGAMESGKSDDFIRRVSREQRKYPSDIGIFKHSIDNRKLDPSSEKNPLLYISSRSGSSISCTPVANVEEMDKIVTDRDFSTIAIDEAQFFDKDTILAFVHKMLARKKKIIISGLDLDAKGRTFGAMGDLAALADTVTKLPAICSACGKDRYCITQFNEKQSDTTNESVIKVGGAELYQPRCRNCHEILNKE